MNKVFIFFSRFFRFSKSKKKRGQRGVPFDDAKWLIRAKQLIDEGKFSEAGTKAYERNRQEFFEQFPHRREMLENVL